MQLFKNDEEYFADTKYLTNSQRKDFDFCEVLYEGKHITKIFQDDEEKDYFTYGSAVDCLLTEKQERFGERFAIVPRRIDVSEFDNLPEAIRILKEEIVEKENAGKPHKMLDDKVAKMQEQLKMADSLIGKTQMTLTMFDNVKESADELLRQPLYQKFGVNDGSGSQAILIGEILGVPIKGKLDYINIEKKVIADIKTVSTMERFNPRIYAAQLAFYRELASQNYGGSPEDWDCYLLVVDKGTSVKRSEIFYMAKEVITQAAAENVASVERFAKVKESGFYTPVVSQDFPNARRERCFSCPFYNQCSFSVQKEITIIN